MSDQHALRLSASPEVPTSSTLDANEETRSLLALGSIHGVGYRTLHKLFTNGVAFSQVLQTPSSAGIAELLANVGVNAPGAIAPGIVAARERAMASAKDMMRDLQRAGVTVLHRFDPRYPQPLADLKHPPGWLFVQGNVDALVGPSVAIVGTREPSRDGENLTADVVFSLRGMKIGTVSGLASGIDQLVHETSIRMQLETVAVLGTGILRDYPASSVPVRESLLRANGCVVSEYLPEDKPTAEHFVWRNRIQAALARIVIPTEWSLKSGTAHTVNHALELRRRLYGVTVPDGRNESHKFLDDHGCPVFEFPLEAPDLIAQLCRDLECW